MAARVEINKEAFAKLAEDPLFQGTVEEHAKRIAEKANAPITMLEEPKFDKWRETHIDYSESRTVKTVSIETFMTFDELTEFVGKLMNAQPGRLRGEND
jgi:hypothetical protein